MNIDLKQLMNCAEISPDQTFGKPKFTDRVTNGLHINPAACELMYQLLQKSGSVNMLDFFNLFASVSTAPPTPSFLSPKDPEPSKQSQFFGGTGPKDLVAELESDGTALFSVLDMTTFSPEGFASAAGLVAALHKTFPKASMQKNALLAKKVDVERKGVIKLGALVDFVVENSGASSYPEVEQILGQAMEREGGSGMECADKMGFSAGGTVSVRDFVEKIGGLTGLTSKRDLYYIYWRILRESGSTADLIKTEDLAEALDSRLRRRQGGPQSYVKSSIVAKRDLTPPAAGAIKKLCDFLYNKDTTKPIMPEETLFRQLDTNRDGFLLRIELKKGFEQRRLGVSAEELDALLTFADRDSDGALSLEEFLTAIKAVRGASMLSSVKLPIMEPSERDREDVLKRGVEKLKRYADRCAKAGEQFEERFVSRDRFSNGAIELRAFMATLKELDIGLTPEEIQYYYSPPHTKQ